MPIGRRRFLVLAALTPAAALSACSDDSPEGSPPRGAGEAFEPDLDAMAFAAGLEVAAEGAYQQALTGASSGKLGEVPAAVSELLRTAALQHRQCLDEINDLLKTAGRSPVEDAPVEFEASVVAPRLQEARGWPEIAALARTIETALAATYLQNIHATLRSPAAIRLAGGIQATGQKRVAILNFLLGEYPVPDTFQKTDPAVRA